MQRRKRWPRLIVVLGIGALLPLLAWEGHAQIVTPEDRGREFGLGVMVGEPTGITGETWLSERTAFDFGAAWSVAGEDRFDLTADHLWYDFDALDTDDAPIAVHYGLGGRVGIEDDDEDRFGVRVPVGLTYFVNDARIGLFAQVAPIVDVAPDTNLEVQGGVGARYFLR